MRFFIPTIVVALISACDSTPVAQSAPTTQPTTAQVIATGAAALDLPLLHEAEAAPAPSLTSATTSVRTAMLATTSPQPATLQSIAPTEGQPSPAPSAPPANVAQPAAKVSAPVRIVIKAIGMDRKLLSVGLDRNNIPVVPKHDVGWYNLSAKPGEGENVVLWGHVLRFKSAPKIPAPFARLKELKPGAKVVLYDAAGTAHQYAVTKQVLVTPEEVEYILPQGKERITMVSCIGDKIVVGGSVEMTHRLITIAEPLS